MLRTDNAAHIANLRQAVGALENPAKQDGQDYAAFGIETIDRAAGGGLALRRVHEVNGLACWTFAALMAGRTRGAILWCARMHQDHALYPPGLVALGCDPRRLVLTECASATDTLWAAEEGLRSGALGAVVIEGEKAMDLTAARRLQLAAEEGGALGLIASPGSLALFPAAATRWHMTPAPGRRFRLDMTRNRNGVSGAWEVSLPGLPCGSLMEERSRTPSSRPSPPWGEGAAWNAPSKALSPRGRGLGEGAPEPSVYAQSQPNIHTSAS